MVDISGSLAQVGRDPRRVACCNSGFRYREDRLTSYDRDPVLHGSLVQGFMLTRAVAGFGDLQPSSP
jgi:hypothetical protein